MISPAPGAVIHTSNSHRSASFLALATIFTGACIGAIEPLPSTKGENLIIIVSTTGATTALDADGYSLSIDSQSAQRVGINASISIASLVPGEHVVRLDNVSPNCSVTGGNVQSVDVVHSADASPFSVSFFVFCSGDGSGAGKWDY